MIEIRIDELEVLSKIDIDDAVIYYEYDELLERMDDNDVINHYSIPRILENLELNDVLNHIEPSDIVNYYGLDTLNECK
jgi:hypothetical protein